MGVYPNDKQRPYLFCMQVILRNVQLNSTCTRVSVTCGDLPTAYRQVTTTEDIETPNDEPNETVQVHQR